MRFFKLVQQHLDDEGGENESENSRISEQDLESPFVEFLNKMRLPPKIKSYTWRKIFYLILEQIQVVFCDWLTRKICCFCFCFCFCVCVCVSGFVIFGF